MDISRQRAADGGPASAVPHAGGPSAKGPRARMRRLMLDTASALMQRGGTPSVSEVAEAAGVSRATAYRYFPSQAALVAAVVAEALGPILDWTPPPGGDARAGVDDLFAAALPRIDAFEATFRAALRLSLDQWSAARGEGRPAEPGFTRGHRVDLLRAALRPLGATLAPAETERLAQALSLLFGVEATIVLKDIWKLDGDQARQVVNWAARALVRAAGEKERGGRMGAED